MAKKDRPEPLRAGEVLEAEGPNTSSAAYAYEVRAVDWNDTGIETDTTKGKTSCSFAGKTAGEAAH